MTYTGHERNQTVVTRAGSQTKTRITVVLTCTGVNRQLPPVILAKSKNQVRNCQDIAGVHVWLQGTIAFMGTNTMQSYSSKPDLSSYLDPVTDYTLLLDCALAHTASSCPGTRANFLREIIGFMEVVRNDPGQRLSAFLQAQLQSTGALYECSVTLNCSSSMPAPSARPSFRSQQKV